VAGGGATNPPYSTRVQRCCILWWNAPAGYAPLSFSDLNYERFKYARTGLKTVVCQLRFNPILKIGQDTPVAFQDFVRHEFPKFVKEESAGLLIGPGGRPEVLPTSPAVWRFTTEDDAWTASLAVDNLSVETIKYRAFPEFERRFRVFEEAFQSVYGVDQYIRVGLRYINILEAREFPGGWLDRLNAQLLGPLGDPVLGSEVAEIRQVFVLAGDDWRIRIRHGTQNGDYLLDIDHATEARVEAKNVRNRLTAFNRRIYQVFRWAISEKLHEEMEPGTHE